MPNISNEGNKSFSVITSVLASAVAANGGTFTASYPTGKNLGSFFLATGHKLVVGQDTLYYPVDFDVTLGASTITITNKTASMAWAAGTQVRLQLNEQGERVQVSVPEQDPNAATMTSGSLSSYATKVRPKLLASTTASYADLVTLGAPAAAAANNICTSQSLASSGALTLNGSLVSSGVATLDVPRAIRTVSTGAATSVLTVTGTDAYGQTMVEDITLNGTTTVNGKKAFKTITGIRASAAVANPITVGTTDILGLPIFLPSAANIIGEIRNGARVGPSGVALAWQASQTDTLAGTTQELVSPINGSIRTLAVVPTLTIVTGGRVSLKVGTTAVTTFDIDVPDSALPGAAQVQQAVLTDGTDAVVAGSAVKIIIGSTFATSGAVNGSVYISGTDGTVVAGTLTAGGATSTTGDVRGTYKPGAACDGTPIQLLAIFPDRYLGIPQFAG